MVNIALEPKQANRLFFYVCRAWHGNYLGGESPLWVRYYQGVEPLAQGKCKHVSACVKEADGKVPPRGTRTVSGTTGGMRLLNKSKSKDYTEVESLKDYLVETKEY